MSVKRTWLLTAQYADVPVKDAVAVGVGGRAGCGGKRQQQDLTATGEERVWGGEGRERGGWFRVREE